MGHKHEAVLPPRSHLGHPQLGRSGGGGGVLPPYWAHWGVLGVPTRYWGVTPSVHAFGVQTGVSWGSLLHFGSPLPTPFSTPKCPFSTMSVHSQLFSHSFPTPPAPFWGHSLFFPHGKVQGSAQPGFWDKRSSFELSQERIRLEFKRTFFIERVVRRWNRLWWSLPCGCSSWGFGLVVRCSWRSFQP